MCVSGSNPAPGQLVPPPSVPIVIAASGPPTLLKTAGSQTLTATDTATGAAAQGVKSAAEALGSQAERLQNQVGDFLAKIRAA